MFNKPNPTGLILSQNTTLRGTAHDTLVIAAPGSGKSRCYIQSNLLQFVGSYVVIDSDGQLRCKTAELFEEKGYNIQVLDINLAATADIEEFAVPKLGCEPTIVYIVPSINANRNAAAIPSLLEKLRDAASEHHEIPIHFILDDLASLGKISDLHWWLVMPAAHISLSLIIQNIPELQNHYAETWKFIAGGCDTILYLGSQDTETINFIYQCIQKETIVSRKKPSIFNRKHRKDDTSWLDTFEAIASLSNKNCIILNKLEPWRIEPKYDLKKHPNYTPVE